MIPVFDAHLDLAWNALSFNRDLRCGIEELRRREAHMKDEACRGHCTTSLPELAHAGVAVCVATLLARSGPGQPLKERYNRTDLDHADPSIAYAVARGQLAYYQLLEQQGYLRFIRTAGALEAHWRQWCKARAEAEPAPIGLILSMEGTDPIVSPEQAEAWWEDGLRAAGLAHYGRSQHACGTGTDGPLSEQGVQLLARFGRLGMALDVTHLCDRSMAQALDLFEGPVLASHHNCRALVPHERQLTDEQIGRLIERDAVIGTALDAWMLFPGWQRGQSSPRSVGLEAVAEHIDHVCQLAGNCHHAAIGSDLDGGFGSEQTPHNVKSIADLQKLAQILSRLGYSRVDVESIFHGNWLRFFSRALPGEENRETKPGSRRIENES
ncbi:MAG: dipeptidase [Acidobacteriota bacterium]